MKLGSENTPETDATPELVENTSSLFHAVLITMAVAIVAIVV